MSDHEISRNFDQLDCSVNVVRKVIPIVSADPVALQPPLDGVSVVVLILE